MKGERVEAISICLHVQWTSVTYNVRTCTIATQQSPNMHITFKMYNMHVYMHIVYLQQIQEPHGIA